MRLPRLQRQRRTTPSSPSIGFASLPSLDVAHLTTKKGTQGGLSFPENQSRDVARRGLFGPVEDGLDGALLEADAGLAQSVTEGCQSGSAELGGRGVVPQQVPRNGTLPELGEAGGVAGHGGFQVVANVAVEGGAFADQVAAVADDELQRGPGLVAGGFEQRATGDGRTMDGGQVGVVGFVAGIDRLAVVLGDKGMQDARLETSRGEGALHDPVIASGAFDGDHTVTDLVLVEGAPDVGDSGIKLGSVVLDHGRGDERTAVKVGEEEFGTDLVAVKADDAEVFGTDLLNAGMEHPARLADRDGDSAAGRTA